MRHIFLALLVTLSATSAFANVTQEFHPPALADAPDNEFGDMVRYGHALFTDTQQLRGKYVNNEMNCKNCHLDDGRRADSAPLWGAYPNYPAFRKKNGHVNTFAERIQGCFTYSMNGTPPPYGSPELTALITYSYWLAQGLPTGQSPQGRKYPKLAKPALAPSVERGAIVYDQQCSVCHGADGQGQKVAEQVVFPPLWGDMSYNWGAGMHRVNTAAGFIKANMPLGKPYSLSDQQAWDVAAYMNSHSRPADPRYNGDHRQTHDDFHQHDCLYQTVNP